MKMNIAIIVHSETGNTHAVARKLEKRYTKNGHSVEVVRLEVKGGYKQGMKDIEFEKIPDIDEYDALVFGSPVEAFSLSPVMKKYLERVGSLKGKKIACFVTKALPFHWTGGNRAIAAMKKLLESKGGAVLGTGIVVWREKRRKERIADVVDRLGGLF